MRNLLNALVASARQRRARELDQLIDAIVATRDGCRIIDLGGEPGYWRSFDRDRLRARNVRITLVNTKAERVDDPLFQAMEADACNLADVASGSFDLAHSNSTLEHVGEWSRMTAFAAEIHRLAPNHYVQTPYFWFPIEPHFLAPAFHWSPETMRVRALMRRGHGHHARCATVTEAMETVRSARLLDRTQFHALFPQSEHSTERFAGLPKSLIAKQIRPVGASH
jgi:hypothetical protein